MSSFVQTREAKKVAFVPAAIRDTATVVIVGIILACVHYLGQPFIRGFQCNDETIRYPHKESTVSSAVCYITGSALNILLILLLEAQGTIFRPKEDNDNARNSRLRLKLYSRNAYCRIIIWLFGSIVSELITDISKFTAGRLRPHFLAICVPRIEGLTYDEYCRSHDPYQYITDYDCTGDPKKQRDARLSFLSGHSSYSAYSAVFAVIYIQAAVDIAKYGLIKPAVQVLIVATAFYTGLTRVSDYKHHWQDVLAGLLLGTTVAIIVSIFVGTTFRKSYAKFTKSNIRPQVSQTGEELNRISY